MMGWIENRPNKFLNQNFVRQGLPAKSKSVRFSLNSLTCVSVNSKKHVGHKKESLHNKRKVTFKQDGPHILPRQTGRYGQQNNLRQ